MTLTSEQLTGVSEDLIRASESRQPISPLTETFPQIDLVDAYNIQLMVVNRRLKAGARVVGKKIGLTSPAMQEMLGVDEPDYGHLFDDMVIFQEEAFPVSRLIQPRIEGEIAFVLEKDLAGPGLTIPEVAGAIAGAMPALEIIDSRITEWKIKIQDTVADNASSSHYVLGSSIVPLTGLDLRYVGYVLVKNGQLFGTGAGADVLGSPLQSVTWLVNKLGEFDIGLKAGEIILSGAASGAVPIAAGDSIQLNVDRIGQVGCCFV